MKLSANARAFVASEVKSAFAEEYRKANAAVDAEENRRKELIKSFRAEVDKVFDETKKEVERIVKRMKLTFHSGKCVDHLDVFASDSRYDSIDADAFEETRDYCKKLQELRQRVNDIEGKIRKATSKALFEIEVHGKRDTLESIVAEVIKSIKEEK